jgi:hypothetical protein
MGRTRYFQVFTNPLAFDKFYRKTRECDRHYYEVSVADRRKMIFDVDIHVTKQDILKIGKYIESLVDHLTGSRSSCLIYRSQDKDKTSYHIVVSELEFTLQECKHIVNILDPHDQYFDRGVYKTIQNFRVEGSTKYNERRHKYLLDTHALSEDVTGGLMYVESSRIPRARSLLTKVVQDHRVFSPNTRSSYKYSRGNHVTKNILADIQELDKSLMEQFKIRRYVSDRLISLTRIHPGYCPLCKREHENENAFLVRNRERWDFNCYRYIQK